MMRQLLESHSICKETATPRAIIKLSYQYNMIDDEQTWLEIQKNRNLLAHTYSEDDSLNIIEKIKDSYLATFIKLKEEVKESCLSISPLDNRGHDDCKQN